MKVERAKADTSEVERQLEANQRTASIQKAVTGASTERATQGTFASLLDARRPADEPSQKEKAPQKADSDDSVDSSAERDNGNKVAPKKTDRDGRDSSGGGDGDSTGGFPFQSPIMDTLNETATIPPARSILHIADIERIVSAIRSESFENVKQVTIDLKNSVLEGLKIRLTRSENGDVKAELLALSEQVKKQLDARKSELEGTLKDRSIKLAVLDIKLVNADDDRADSQAVLGLSDKRN